MPGYGKRMEVYSPTTTEDVQTVKQRFVMPTFPMFTAVQMVIVAIIILYAYKARKVKGSVVASLGLTVGLLHMYDHLFRVKRGDERLFFFPEAKKEGYCGACRK